MRLPRTPPPRDVIAIAGGVQVVLRYLGAAMLLVGFHFDPLAS